MYLLIFAKEPTNQKSAQSDEIKKCPDIKGLLTGLLNRILQNDEIGEQ